MVLAALALAVSTAAGIAATQVATAPPARIAIAVRANGELSDDFWNAIPATDGFLQREPEEGGTPSQRTEFRVAYDATTLFVKVHAFDTDTSQIVSYLTRRDGDSPSDWIRVLLDSYHDKRTAYEFAVNPAGVKSDRYWYNDNNSDDSWDAVWDVRSRAIRTGGRAEFRIPFSQVRFTPSDVDHLRLRGDAADRPAERDDHVAAARAQRQRLRLVVRRSRAACRWAARRSGSRRCRTRWLT